MILKENNMHYMSLNDLQRKVPGVELTEMNLWQNISEITPQGEVVLSLNWEHSNNPYWSKFGGICIAHKKKSFVGEYFGGYERKNYIHFTSTESLKELLENMKRANDKYDHSFQTITIEISKEEFLEIQERLKFCEDIIEISIKLKKDRNKVICWYDANK